MMGPNAEKMIDGAKLGRAELRSRLALAGVTDDQIEAACVVWESSYWRTEALTLATHLDLAGASFARALRGGDDG